jgi:plastocyanin
MSTTYSFSTPQTYAITATAGAHGAISPSGSADVIAGHSQTYTITPASGYEIDSLTVDGSPVSAQASYTFSNVTAAHTIAAAFRAIPVTGGVTPDSTTAQSGGSVTFTPSWTAAGGTFVWDFGDSSTPVSTTATQAVSHEFDRAGAYTVTCSQMDGSTVLATMPTAVTVKAGKVEVAPTQAVAGVNVLKSTETLTDITAGDLIDTYGVRDATIEPLKKKSEFDATIDQAGQPAVFRFSIYAMDMDVASLRLLKLKADGTNKAYTYGSSASRGTEGAWWISEDSTGNDVALGDTLDPARLYWVNFVILDNGSYDADPTPGVIHDPLALAQSGAADSSDGSGGCVYLPAGGAGIELALLLLGGASALALRRRRR